MVDKQRKVGQKRAPREVYVSPKLKVFGPVGALTQAGTGMANETAMDMTPMFNKQRP